MPTHTRTNQATNRLVSVIIPTKNSSLTIPQCLKSVQNQTYANIECIVVDNFSSDDTVRIAESAGAHVISAGNERSAQRNRGFAESAGAYILFLDSDMELGPHVIDNCIEIIQKSKGVKAIIIPEESFGTGFWAKCKAFEKSFYHNVPWMNAARFFMREAYELIGGFSEEIIGGEDFDIQNTIIKQFGERGVTIATKTIRHNEGKLSLKGIWMKKYYYGSTIATYKNKKQNMLAFRKQSSLIKRIILFSSQPKKISRHPLLYIGTIIMKTMEFIAGGLGYVMASHTS